MSNVGTNSSQLGYVQFPLWKRCVPIVGTVCSYAHWSHLLRSYSKKDTIEIESSQIEFAFIHLSQYNGFMFFQWNSSFVCILFFGVLQINICHLICHLICNRGMILTYSLLMWVCCSVAAKFKNKTFMEVDSIEKRITKNEDYYGD